MKKGAETKIDFGALDDKMIEKLIEHKGQSLFKRASLNMLVKMASDQEIIELRKQF